MNKPEKNHNTGLRILEVLKILLESDISKNELIIKLKENSQVENVYTYETFIKYFNTLEIFGLKLEKDKNRYKLGNSLIKLNLNKEEEKILNKIISNFRCLHNKSAEEKISNIIKKLNKYIDVDIESKLNECVINDNFMSNNVKDNIIATLKKLIYDEQDVSITYKKSNGTEDTIAVVLKDIIDNGNETYVFCYNPKIARNKKININSIVSLKQMPTKISGMQMVSSVVFEIYGRFASSYKLKKSEKVLDFGYNHITISNTEEDKDMLLLRLLKYGENCKILKPKEQQEEFMELTAKILKNLES